MPRQSSPASSRRRCLPACPRRLRRRRPSTGGTQAGHQLARHRHVRRLRRPDPRHHLLGGEADGSRPRDFYSAGGGITGFQNGLAIAGDYMSAASFLGISGLVYTSGYDGLIYSVGWLVGWPIVTVPDRRAAAQPRQVHLRRRRLVPARADARSASSRPAARWSPSPST